MNSNHWCIESPHVRKSAIRNPANICCWWNPEWNPLWYGFRNPESWNPESRGRDPESRTFITKRNSIESHLLFLIISFSLFSLAGSLFSDILQCFFVRHFATRPELVTSLVWKTISILFPFSRKWREKKWRRASVLFSFGLAQHRPSKLKKSWVV